MNIPRLRLFSSEKSENKDKNKSSKGRLGIAAGSAVAGAGLIFQSNNKKDRSEFLDKIEKKIDDASNSINKKEGKKLKKELLDKARKMGIRVIHDPEYDNSCFVPENSLSRGWRKLVASVAKKDRKAYKAIKEKAEKMSEKTKRPKKLIPHLGKNTIILGKEGPLTDAPTISHELGHSHYGGRDHWKRSKDVVAKAAHSMTSVGQLASTKGGRAGLTGIGFIQGVKSANKSEKLIESGEDKKKVGKEAGKDMLKSMILPAAAVTPLLIAEGAASKKGIRLLKEAGASKETIKAAKKELINAHKTYDTSAARSVLTSLGGEMAGYGAGTVYHKAKKKKHKDKEDNK